jgi:flavin-dependent dehydrogenase
MTTNAPSNAPPNLDGLDAIVCGGGPAGSTFATTLARAGRKVAVFEREKFPRFHIGESLLPWNVPLLERIGALDKVRTEGMQVKYGARFYHQGTDKTRFVRFADGMDDKHPSAFQVKRGDFDKLLLDHARESGAAVYEEARVEDVLWEGAEGGRARGVRVRLPGETQPREVTARFVADATGRDALLSRKLGGHRRDPQLDRSAAFAHFDTFNRAEGPTGGDIVVITTPDGWWWMIPFSDGTVSVGIVMPARRFKQRKGSVDDLFNESIAGAPELRAHLGPGKRTSEIYAIADYSYCASKIVGDGYCLIGDAACFLDPVFSTGVLLAMTAGEMAGTQVSASLARNGRVDASDLRRFEKVYLKGADRFRRFVHGFYQPHFLEVFYAEAPSRKLVGVVTSLLGGGVFEPDLKTRAWMTFFYGAVGFMKIQHLVRGAGEFARGTGIVEPEASESGS